MSKYEVSLDDPALKNVEEEKTIATDASNATFDKAIADSNKGYDNAIDASRNWVDRQTQLQKDQHAQNLKEIEQQKEQTRKDYIKEQSGAYADWQKQADPYGVNAERMASMGMSNTGYSESSQVSMYNAYQNRVAIARESYQRAVIDYDNQMQQAKLQNSTILAEIAYQGLQEQLKYAIEKVSAGNTLLVQKASEARAIDAQYQSKWQSVYNALSNEASRKMQEDQFNTEMAFKEKQFEESVRQFNETNNKGGKITGGSSGGSSGSSGGSKSSSSGGSSEVKNTNSSEKAALIKKLNSVKTFAVAGGGNNTLELFLKHNGISPSIKPINSTVWNKEKRTGTEASEFRYASYDDYARAFALWAINEKYGG